MPKSKEDILELMVQRLDRCIKYEDHNRKSAIEDLKFLNGEQWEAAEKARRSTRNRPALQDNRLPTYVDQVVGDERHNRPKGFVKPVDSKGDIQIARIRQGIIWNIEYLSNAESIYDYACEMQVSCGYGAWRILTRYTDENPFMQEIYLERILNPFAVYLDPDAKDSVRADAKFGFILEKMSIKEFEDQYPNAEPPAEGMKTGQGVSYENWFDGEKVTIAEYFVRESVTKKFALMDDGSVVEYEEAQKIIKKWETKAKEESEKAIVRIATQSTPQAQVPGQAPLSMPSPNQPPLLNPPGPQSQAQPPTNPNQPPMVPSSPISTLGPKPSILKTRDAESFKIKHYIATAIEILKEDEFPGKYIPIVPVYGRERNIEGKPFIRGLIRDAKDPQKLLNYWTSSAAETIALAPKTPWIGTAKHFEGYEGDYAVAHIENFPFLKYNVDPASPASYPQRAPSIQPPVAIFSEIDRAAASIKASVGMFNADIGDQGPERSGAAIRQRQKPGDIATYSFLDNLARSICHSYRVINDMIPEVYDTERDVRIRNIDDSETFVPINTTAEHALDSIESNPDRYFGLSPEGIRSQLGNDKSQAKSIKYNDITVGKYDVVIKTGPSYATQREEAADALLRLAQAEPEIIKIGGDLITKYMDVPGADELSSRLKKLLPPGLVDPKPGEPPQKPLPPSPQAKLAEAKVQLEQARVQLEQQKIQVQASKVEVEKIKAATALQDTKGELKNMLMEMLQELIQTPPVSQPNQSTPQTQTNPNQQLLPVPGFPINPQTQPQAQGEGIF